MLLTPAVYVPLKLTIRFVQMVERETHCTCHD